MIGLCQDSLNFRGRPEAPHSVVQVLSLEPVFQIVAEQLDSGIGVRVGPGGVITRRCPDGDRSQRSSKVVCLFPFPGPHVEVEPIPRPPVLAGLHLCLPKDRERLFCHIAWRTSSLNTVIECEDDCVEDCLRAPRLLLLPGTRIVEQSERLAVQFLPVLDTHPGLREQLFWGRCFSADELSQNRACQRVRENSVTAYASRSRLSFAAVGRREREPGFLALVQVFSRRIRLPTLTLSTAASQRTSDKNNDQDENDSETAQQHFHNGSC